MNITKQETGNTKAEKMEKIKPATQQICHSTKNTPLNIRMAIGIFLANTSSI